MDFTNVKSFNIPEGSVAKLSSGGSVRWAKSSGGLPPEYQRVEYISKSRETMAYIDLGFAFDKGATVYLDYYKTETSYYLFGAAENSGKLRCMMNDGMHDVTNRYFYGSNGSGYLIVLVDTSLGEHSVVLTAKPGCLKGEDRTLGFTSNINTQQAEYTMTNHLYLMAQNYNGSPRSSSSVQVKAFSYYDNDDILICDLVPCYRKSDGEIGMYDVVRKIFLTNAGTGTFTKGADV